jgi:hypothetical protein
VRRRYQPGRRTPHLPRHVSRGWWRPRSPRWRRALSSFRRTRLRSRSQWHDAAPPTLATVRPQGPRSPTSLPPRDDHAGAMPGLRRNLEIM